MGLISNYYQRKLFSHEFIRTMKLYMKKLLLIYRDIMIHYVISTLYQNISVSISCCVNFHVDYVNAMLYASES